MKISRPLRVLVGIALSAPLLVLSAPAGADPLAAPGAPTNVVATYQGGQTQTTVSWKAPTSGNPPASSYRVTGGGGCYSTSLSCVVSNLTPGQSYSFTVVAYNNVGHSPASKASNTVTIVTLNGAPGGLGDTYTQGTTSLTVHWTPPTTGYPAVASYSVAISPGSAYSTTFTSYTFTGLTPGVGYTVTVTPVNSVGRGLSAAIGPLVITAVPSAPLDVRAVVYDSTIRVSWTAPTSGYPSTSRYVVTSSPLGRTCTTTTTVCGFYSMPAGTYTFSVVPSNVAGPGPAATSAAVQVVVQLGSPGRPTFAPLAPNVHVVHLTWSRASGCASGCTYEVYANNRVIGSTASPATAVSGLVTGTTYRFRVRPVMSGRSGPFSVPSAPAVVWIDALRSGSLTAAVPLWSANRATYAVISAGRLVIRSNSGATLWVAPGTGTALVVDNGDVMFMNRSQVVWSSRTAAPGAVLVVSGALLELYQSGRLIWRSAASVTPTTIPVTPTTRPVTTTTRPVTTTTVPGVPIP